MKHEEKWYQRRLAKYFTEHYDQYEDSAEYWPDPAPNQWLFEIAELEVRVELTCDDLGNVTEKRFEKKVEKTTYPVDQIYKFVRENAQDFDAIYEDYIIHLVGEVGFDALRKHKLLESCGSVNGRNLYTLIEK